MLYLAIGTDIAWSQTLTTRIAGVGPVRVKYFGPYLSGQYQRSRSETFNIRVYCIELLKPAIIRV